MLISVMLLVITISLFLILPNDATLSQIPLTYASVPAIVEAPAHIALKKEFFKGHGLDITMEINPDGKTSLDQLFAGTVDIAAVMATPIVFSSFEREDFIIIGKIDHAKIHFAYASEESDIDTPQDLSGKRVAYMPNTSGHYFLNNWLLYNHLTPEDIIPVPCNGPEALEAMEKGRADAMFYWFPFPQLLKERLGDQIRELESNRLVPSSWIIVTKREFADNNREAVLRFLRSLKESINFIEEAPKISEELYAEMNALDSQIIGTIFPTLHFDLILDQSLLLDLEEQARWAISLQEEKTPLVPNFLDIIDVSFLKEISPSSVSIIGR